MGEIRIVSPGKMWISLSGVQEFFFLWQIKFISTLNLKATDKRGYLVMTRDNFC